MLRAISILLLLLMPLQAIHAAAVSYCQHERSAVTAHVGHHAHKHRQSGPSASVSDQSSDTQPLTGDLDCLSCHGSFGVAEVVLPCSIAQPRVSQRPADVTSTIPEPPPALLERPKWLGLV